MYFSGRSKDSGRWIMTSGAAISTCAISWIRRWREQSAGSCCCCCAVNAVRDDRQRTGPSHRRKTWRQLPTSHPAWPPPRTSAPYTNQQYLTSLSHINARPFQQTFVVHRSVQTPQYCFPRPKNTRTIGFSRTQIMHFKGLFGVQYLHAPQFCNTVGKPNNTNVAFLLPS